MNETVSTLQGRAERSRRLRRAIEARRLLESSAEQAWDRPPGRAWLNGRELGTTNARLAHLEASYD